MQPSAIQLTECVYLGIKVVPRPPSEDDMGGNFDFEGVFIGEGVDLSILDENKENPKIFGIKLHIVIENKEGKKAPYDIDIEAAGVFSIAEDMPIDTREDFVKINGCAVLYSAIRDQVLTLTSRSMRGAMMLPTVNFLDLKRKIPE